MVTYNELVKLLCDRFTTAELAEFLDISVEDFCAAFEEDIETNYEELAEWIGLRAAGENTDDEDY